MYTRRQKKKKKLTSHGKSSPSPSITSVSCGPFITVGGAKTLSTAGGAVLLPAILCAEHSYLPASDACTSDIIRLPESTIESLKFVFLFVKIKEEKKRKLILMEHTHVYISHWEILEDWYIGVFLYMLSLGAVNQNVFKNSLEISFSTLSNSKKKKE